MNQSRWNPGRVDQLPILRFGPLIPRQQIAVETNIENGEISAGHV